MVKTNKNLSENRIKALLPSVKNKARKTELMLKRKFELKQQKKKDRDKRKKEREAKGLPVIKYLAFRA